MLVRRTGPVGESRDYGRISQCVRQNPIYLLENAHDVYGDRNGVNLASAEGGGVGSLRQPVQRSCRFANQSLVLALGLDSQKDNRVTLAEALLLVWLEQCERGKAESGRQKNKWR